MIFAGRYISWIIGGLPAVYECFCWILRAALSLGLLAVLLVFRRCFALTYMRENGTILKESIRF